jgi:hypothetical protein
MTNEQTPARHSPLVAGSASARGASPSRPVCITAKPTPAKSRTTQAERKLARRRKEGLIFRAWLPIDEGRTRWTTPSAVVDVVDHPDGIALRLRTFHGSLAIDIRPDGDEVGGAHLRLCAFAWAWQREAAAKAATVEAEGG